MNGAHKSGCIFLSIIELIVLCNALENEISLFVFISLNIFDERYAADFVSICQLDTIKELAPAIKKDFASPDKAIEF